MKVKILRQKSPEDESYWEGFDYYGPSDHTIASVLDYINNDITYNDQGVKTRKIMWDCSCMQGVCGACAMVINETPRLACETFVDSIKGNEIIIRPLRKFPVICDLMLDRSIIHDNLKKNIIGDVRCVTANIGYNLGGRERLLKPELAGGALLDLGVYVLNFASMVFGDGIDSIAANCVKLDSGVDAQENIMLTYILYQIN